MTSNQLINLRRKDAYYASDEAPEWVGNVWPRIQSFNHFIKYNRDHLIEAGALVKIGRDFFVDKETFPEVASHLLGVTDGGQE